MNKSKTLLLYSIFKIEKENKIHFTIKTTV
jgi:hypothetical protein